MRSLTKFAIALGAAALLMLVFRATVLTVYEVGGNAMQPDFEQGDRLLVNRWSYGLRTCGGKMFGYMRWAASAVVRGDLVAFNDPSDTLRRIAARRLAIGYCTGVPGDTVRIGDRGFVLPGKRRNVKVTPANIRLLCHIYRTYEGADAAIRQGRLIVDGEQTGCAAFTKDYYWLTAPGTAGKSKATGEGIVPEDHIIGRAVMLLYSADPCEPFYNCLRPGRQLLFIRND